MYSIEEKVLKIIFETGMVQQFFLFVFSILTFDRSKLIRLTRPARFPRTQAQITGDHFFLHIESVLHPANDVLVGFGFCESE